MKKFLKKLNRNRFLIIFGRVFFFGFFFVVLGINIESNTIKGIWVLISYILLIFFVMIFEYFLDSLPKKEIWEYE